MNKMISWWHPNQALSVSLWFGWLSINWGGGNKRNGHMNDDDIMAGERKGEEISCVFLIAATATATMLLDRFLMYICI